MYAFIFLALKCFDQNNGPFLPECSSFHKLQGSFKRALSKQAAIMYRDKAGVNATSEPHNATLKTQEHQFVIDFRSIFHNFLFKKSLLRCNATIHIDFSKAEKKTLKKKFKVFIFYFVLAYTVAFGNLCEFYFVFLSRNAEHLLFMVIIAISLETRKLYSVVVFC